MVSNNIVHMTEKLDWKLNGNSKSITPCVQQPSYRLTNKFYKTTKGTHLFSDSLYKLTNNIRMHIPSLYIEATYIAYDCTKLLNLTIPRTRFKLLQEIIEMLHECPHI